MDAATIYFTEIQLQKEIRDVFAEIKLVRNDMTIPDVFRDLELCRLFDLYNNLGVELVRLQEQCLDVFLNELQLDDIGANLKTDGKLKVHVLKKDAVVKAPMRSVSYGFIDPIYQDQQIPTSMTSVSSASNILLDRKRTIKEELYILSRKDCLSDSEKIKQSNLLNDLRSINK